MLLLIIFGIKGILLVALGIYLLTGRGWFLLAGYNTMSKSEKEKYDIEALCKFNGKIALSIGILTLFMGFESIIRWFIWVYVAIVIFLCIFAAVYCKTGNRFRK